jgi:uncharacterized protein (DUF983 family)
MNPLTRIATALRLRCPRCHDGKLFTGLLKMNATCPNCGLTLEPDPGFYLGSVYANYAATVLIATSAFMILVFAYGWKKDSVIWWCTAFTTLFPLWFLATGYEMSVHRCLAFRCIFLELAFHFANLSVRKVVPGLVEHCDEVFDFVWLRRIANVTARPI